MANDEVTLRKSARERFAEWQQGDPRGILANVPIHFQTESLTKDIARGVGKVYGAYTAKRQALLDAQAAAAKALTEHQRKLEQEAVAPRTKGEQDRLTIEAGRKPYGAAGYLLTPNAAGGYDRTDERFRPPSNTVFNANARVSDIDRETARQKAIADLRINLESTLGSRWGKAQVQAQNPDGSPRTNTDGSPVIVAMEGAQTRKLSDLSTPAQNLFWAGARLRGAVVAGEISPADAVREFDSMRPKPVMANTLTGPITTMPVPVDVQNVYGVVRSALYAAPLAAGQQTTGVAPLVAVPADAGNNGDVTPDQAAEIAEFMQTNPAYDYETAKAAVTGK